MALYQPSHIIPDMRSGVGEGTVDLTQEVTVSWRINGPSAMTAFDIAFYENDTSSTLLFTHSKTLDDPVYGTSYTGEIELYECAIAASEFSSAGMSNGNEYKLCITQYWSSGSITQNSMSVFQARTEPTLTVNTSGASTPASTFTGTYTQAEGDELNWFRWQLALEDNTDNPFYDSGMIFGTSDITCVYDGILPNIEYSVKLTVQTENGIEATTGWTDFAVWWISPAQDWNGTFEAGCVGGTDAVFVRYTDVEILYANTTFSIYRQAYGESLIRKIASVEISGSVGDTTSGTIYDYSAASQQGPYMYYLYDDNYRIEPLTTGYTNPVWWNWTLMDCSETDNSKIFTVNAAYKFRLNVESGAISNNNSPNILNNFTRYPKVQIAPQNYRSGTLTALVGAVLWEDGLQEYKDTLAWKDALYALSTSQNPLFLKNRKGDLMRIRISGPITMTTADETAEQIQTISLPWVEVGSTDGVSLYSEEYVGVQESEGESNAQYYVDVSDATAEADDIYLDKKAVSSSGLVTGEATFTVSDGVLIAPENIVS